MISVSLCQSILNPQVIYSVNCVDLDGVTDVESRDVAVGTLQTIMAPLSRHHQDTCRHQACLVDAAWKRTGSVRDIERSERRVVGYCGHVAKAKQVPRPE